VFHFAFRDKFLLISESPHKAEAAGLNIRLWDFLFYLSFGFVITLSVNVAGVLLVFVFLVAPAVMALAITDRLFHQVLFGWLLGLFATGAGLFCSYVLDLPAGPGVVAAYAVALVVVAAIVFNARAADRPAAFRTTAATAAFFIVAFGLLFAAGRILGEHTDAPGHLHTAADEPGAVEHPGETGHNEAELLMGEPGLAPEVSEEELAEKLSATQSTEEVRQLFSTLTTPAARTAIISRALELDPATGASLTIELLKTDPPLLYRQMVIDALTDVMGEPAGFDSSESFAGAVNQQAAAKVAKRYSLEGGL
jgi:hypothetical protein